MKSILVDALRQANGDDSDKALSDSGSIDTNQEPLVEPANDSIGDEHGELELMSTTNALVLQEETQHENDASARSDEPDVDEDFGTDAGQAANEAIANTTMANESIAYEPVDDEHAMTVAGMMPLPVTRRQSPHVARFTPLLCVVLGFAVATSWLLINKLGIFSTGLGTTVAQASSTGAADEGVNDPVPESRFRFLDGDEPASAGGSAQ